ncbi:MAG: hypothetical protein EZS28_019647 [Streblomastix strix]|uniref:Uncharacterized protein n=1 Tax=Streblomastix strix TaxID=222440 RepID=A0A5J4VQR0_9EUKA|nr:MAG: hypothetical protein EZS28_019647 [Streblomastix strix]
MSFKSSDYLGRLEKWHILIKLRGYMYLGQVLITFSIHPLSFEISKQNFFDSPITELISRGVKYTRASLGASGKSARSTVQIYQENQTVIIPANTLAIQLNKTAVECDTVAQRFESLEHLQFWIGLSTVCGPFYQFQLMKDATALWRSAIYAREQAVIRGNSLSDLCTKNMFCVSQLESIIQGKRHCGVFIDIPLCEIDRLVAAGTPFYYRITDDITYSELFGLNQLNPIFNSFPVLTRNYAALLQQFWIQDFLQDLKLVWLNKNDIIQNNHLTYHMIPPEQPDIVYLLAEEDIDGMEYQKYNIRIVKVQKAANGDKLPQNSISQIGTDKFDASITLMMHYLCDAFIRIIFSDISMPQVLNIEQSIGIAPFHNIGQPYPLYANSTAFNRIKLGVPENFGFIALSMIANKVYPDSHIVLGSE